MVTESEDQIPEETEGGGIDEIPFRQLADKTLLSPVLIASWSPTMDLLAMATADGQLMVHRLNWQRLWTVTPAHAVTALCWQPNGKVLAAGREDGGVVLYDVETGEVHRQLAEHSAAVTCMEWVEEDAEVGASPDSVFSYTDRTARFFPLCPPPPQGPESTPLAAFDVTASSEPGAAPADKASGSLSSRLSILSSADSQGLVCLQALGAFLIGKVNLREVEFQEPMEPGKFTGVLPQKMRDAEVVKTSLSSDLRHLSIVARGTFGVVPVTPPGRLKSRSAPAPKPVQGPPGLYMLSVDAGLLGDRKNELLQVAIQASSITTLVDTAQQTLDAMIKQWEGAYGDWKKRIVELIQILNKQEREGFEANPRDEFLALLSCGLATAGLHQFLTGAMGEQGVKRLARTMDVACANIHALAAETLQPVLEVLTFRLGELRGLARWKARLGPLGVNELALNEPLEYAKQTMVHTERLLRKTATMCGEYRVFFTWLLRCIKTLNQEPLPAPTANDALPPVSTEAVADFLQPKFDWDPLADLLSRKDMDPLPAMDEQGKELMQGLAAMGGFQDYMFLHNSLRQQLQRLRHGCDVALSLPCKVTSSALRITSTVLLCPSPSGASDPAKRPMLTSAFVKAPAARADSNAEASTGMEEDEEMGKGPWEYWCLKPGANAGDAASSCDPQHSRPLLVLRRRPPRDGHVSPEDWPAAAREITPLDPESFSFDASPQTDRQWKELAALKVPVWTQKGSLVPYDDRAFEAVAVALGNWPGNGGKTIVDLGFYKDGEIAVLVRDESPDARSWLLLLPTGDLPFAPVGNTLVDKEPMALLALCLETEAIHTVDWGEGKLRELSLHAAITPLAVSGKRGVACVSAGHRRILLYDLEDSESNEDEI